MTLKEFEHYWVDEKVQYISENKTSTNEGK